MKLVAVSGAGREAVRKKGDGGASAPQVLRVHNGGGLGGLQVFFAGAAIKALDLRPGQTAAR